MSVREWRHPPSPTRRPPAGGRQGAVADAARAVAQLAANALAQGVEDVLWAAVLAVGELLAQLAGEQTRHPVPLQLADQLPLGEREIG